MNRITRTLGLLLLMCLAVRLAAWLVTPVLPALGGLFVFVLLGPGCSRADGRTSGTTTGGNERPTPGRLLTHVNGCEISEIRAAARAAEGLSTRVPAAVAAFINKLEGGAT